MSNKKINEYKTRIARTVTADDLKLIADIMNQELEKMYPKIRAKRGVKGRDKIRDRERDVRLREEDRSLREDIRVLH